MFSIYFTQKSEIQSKQVFFLEIEPVVKLMAIMRIFHGKYFFMLLHTSVLRENVRKKKAEVRSHVKRYSSETFRDTQSKK